MNKDFYIHYLFTFQKFYLPLRYMVLVEFIFDNAAPKYIKKRTENKKCIVHSVPEAWAIN